MHAFSSSRGFASWFGILGFAALGLAGVLGRARADAGPRVAPLADQVLTQSVLSDFIPFVIEQPAQGTVVQASVPDRYRDRISAQAVFGLRTGYVTVFFRNPSQSTFPAPVTFPLTLTAILPAAVAPYQIATTNRTSFQVTYLPRELNDRLSVPMGSRFATTLSAKMADLTDDGNPEIITLGAIPGRITMAYLNQSVLTTVTPQDPSRTISTGAFRGFEVTDFNNDGSLDLITIDGASRVGLFQHKPTVEKTNVPAFTPVTLASSEVEAASTVWADLDNDGLPDLVVIPPASGSPLSPTYSSPRVFWNRGTDGFSEGTGAENLPVSAGPAVAADFDGDGMIDLFLSNIPTPGGTTNDMTGALMLNLGDGTFARSPASFPKGWVQAAGWTDLNGDGIPDLWTTVRLPEVGRGELRLLEQQSGTSKFVQTAAVPVGAPGGSRGLRGFGVTFGDFDNDGTVDFIAPSRFITFIPMEAASLKRTTNSALAVWHNDGHGKFTPGGPLEEAASPGYFATLASADLDGDGSLDLLKAGSPESSVGVAVNRSSIPNLPPTPPANLSATVLGNWVFFNWKPGTDANQTAPLSYNLRVGTFPGGNDLMSSLSRPDGTRMIPTFGNAGFRTFQLLNLTHANAATIYWSVQSVDAAFQGSVFAGEKTLTLDTNHFTPPQLLGLGNLEIPTNTPTAISFHVSDEHARASALAVQASSADVNLLDLTALKVTNAATINDPGLRTLTIRPLPGAQGVATVTVTVTNGYGLATSQTIRVGIPSLRTSRTTVNPIPGLIGTGSLALPMVGPNAPEIESASNPTPALLNGPRWADGKWTLWMEASDTLPRRLEQSADLMNWEPTAASGTQTNGRVEFHLTPAETDRILFFRAVPGTD